MKPNCSCVLLHIKDGINAISDSFKPTRVNEFCIRINGLLIKRVTEFRYLGVLLDECIVWKSHVKNLFYMDGWQE